MIRFDSSSLRGPTSKLWGGLADWHKGTILINDDVAVDAEDYVPFNAGNHTLSADSGAAAAITGDDGGVVQFTATAGTYAVAGAVRNLVVDLDTSKDLCTQARVKRTAGATGEEITVVGFTDQLAAAVFHSDGTLDGGSGEDGFMLRWNNDLTVDLVSVINSSATVLVTGIASLSNTGFHKIGLRVKRQTATKCQITVDLDGTIYTYRKLYSQLPTAAVKPVVVTTISATDAPTIDVDWHCTINRFTFSG